VTPTDPAVTPERPAPTAETLLETGLDTFVPDPFHLIIRATAPVVSLDLSHDVRCIGTADAGLLLLAVEEVLVAAAGGDLRPGDLDRIVRLAPVRRDPGWVRHGRTWLDRAVSQRLLQQAVGDPGARLFVDPESGLLVGYSAPAAPMRPELQHAACMARLGTEHGASAPDRYVVCGRAPADLDDASAWRAQPVHFAGSGRRDD
jgi:hypothetical protein